MPGNRGVAYMGPGKVEITDLDYPEFLLKDGPGVNPAQRWSQSLTRGDSESASPRTSAAVINIWSAAGPRRRPG